MVIEYLRRNPIDVRMLAPLYIPRFELINDDDDDDDDDQADKQHFQYCFRL